MLVKAVVWLNSTTSHATKTHKSTPDRLNPTALLKPYPASANCLKSKVDHGNTAKAAT